MIGKSVPVSPQRIAFEAWAATQTGVSLYRDPRKGYTSLTTRVAWRAWQAAQGKPESPSQGLRDRVRST